MVFQNWTTDIKEKTAKMNRKDTASYILTYYWYHILIIAAMVALMVLFVWHYLFGNKKALFTCLLINQEVTNKTADEMGEEFAASAGLSSDRIVIDSNYYFSYGDVEMEGVNETSYEKFFLQWRNGEIDAVICPESLYLYCKELGGSFYAIEEGELGDFDAYTDEETGICTAAILGVDSLTEALSGKTDEKLLLCFPSTGKHEETSVEFLEYLNEAEREYAEK